MMYMVEHIATGKRLKEGDNLFFPYGHLQIKKIEGSGGFVYGRNNDNTHEEYWACTATSIYRIITVDASDSPVNVLTFDRKKETVEIETEQTRITLTDAEVRAIVEKHIRDTYPQVTRDYDVKVLSIVPSMETDVKIWRKI